MGLKYGLEDKPRLWETVIYGVQWGVMILSSNIFLPLILAQALGFPSEMTAAFVQRTLIFIGVGSLIQIYLGHRITVFEAVAAFWLSTFLIIGTEGLAAGQTLETIVGKVQFLYIVTGLLIVLLTVTGATAKLNRLFTPLIMGVTLVLICIQVSGNMVEGMFRSLDDGGASPSLVAFSLFMYFAVLWISFKGGRFRAIVGLIGLGGGWALFRILGMETRPMVEMPGLVAPEVFAMGPPLVDWSVAPLALFIVIIYLSNEIASINAGAEALKVSVSDRAIRRASYAGGVIHILAAVFSSIALVPAAMASGLTATTGVGARRSMAAGCFFLILLGLIGPVGGFFASIPPAVSYSVSLGIFSRILAIGLKNCFAAGSDERTLVIISVSVILGAGIMFLPPGMFEGFGFFSGILSNGLFIGVLTALFLENILFRKKGWD